MLYDFTFEDNIDIRRDAVLFDVLFSNILPKEHDIGLTNGRSVIIGRSNKDIPAWVWTADDITTLEYNEFMTYIPAIFGNDEKIKFTAKPNTADDIASLLGGEIIKAGGLVSYKCETVISPKPTGTVKYPDMSDVDRIAEFLRGFTLECFGSADKVETYIDKAANLIPDENFYVLDVDGVTAAMAYMHPTNYNYMRYNRVYTQSNYRNRGHAAYLVSEMCKKAIEFGKLPILYADEFNPASNKAYRNIGFTECGRLKEIEMVKI